MQRLCAARRGEPACEGNGSQHHAWSGYASARGCDIASAVCVVSGVCFLAAGVCSALGRPARCCSGQGTWYGQQVTAALACRIRFAARHGSLQLYTWVGASCR